MIPQEENELSVSEIDFFERLNYFFGKLLTARDFLTEQSYFNEKRWLLNRQTIGWGVVCGLEVREKPDCPAQVVVGRGLALDKYGYEIYVGSEQIVDLFPKENGAPEEETDYFVCIRYRECFVEPVPAPTQECDSRGTACHYSRVWDFFELKSSTEKDLSSSKPGPEMNFDGLLPNFCDEITNPCKPRLKYQWLILAKVTFRDGAITHIDNNSLRKRVWSNEILTSMVHRVRAARIDRRQFVPLLAQTIKGLTYRDGRILTLNEVGEKRIGHYPFSITPACNHIWVTDQEENSIRKLARDGNTLEEIELPYPSWGIAFDGKYIWVTHIAQSENLGKVSRVNVADISDIEHVDLVTPEPREIVFDGQYMWLSHSNRFITKVHATDPTKQKVFDRTGEITAEITDLAFDGTALWVGYDENNGLRKIDIEDDTINVSDPISINDGNPKGIFFDGTHIWVGHEHGASKVDIDLGQQIGTMEQVTNLTRVVFDGMYAWALQPNQNTINRIDIFDIRVMGNIRIREVRREENHQILRVCFDGVHIWVTAFLGVAEEKIGIIYRLLS